MSKRDLRLYIEDILESIEAIENYIKILAASMILKKKGLISGTGKPNEGKSLVEDNQAGLFYAMSKAVPCMPYL